MLDALSIMLTRTQLILLSIFNIQGVLLCWPSFWTPQKVVLTTGPSHMRALVLW